MTELDLVGCAMQDPRITSASRIRPQHFADGRLGQVWGALTVLAEKSLTPTPPLVIAELGLTGDAATRAAAMLVDAITSAVLPNHETYAAHVLEAAERRSIHAAATRAAAMIDADQPTEAVRQVLASAAGPDTDDDQLAAEVFTLDEFVDRELPDEKWIVPDLLAAGDRLILTGGEGSGKSILLRMIGAAVASGCHPFTRRSIRPSRVLMVDCENPERIMVDKLGRIRNTLRMGGFETQGRMHVVRYPGGLDLTTPKGRTTLRHLCSMVNPELIIIGPIYKLYVQTTERDEVPARQIAAVIDELRAEYDCAVLTEHHTPMQQVGHARQIRPVGTGLWQRWPEFGLGLVPQDGTKPEDRQMQLVAWRGSRDERDWPTRLQGSGNAPGRLPWVDADNQGTAWRPHPQHQIGA